jgi:hypothetical protein
MVEPPAGRAGLPLVVGWKEYVALPELGVSSIKAKIDTGARTSSLHVAAIRRLSGRDDGEAEIEITMAPDRRRPERLVRARVHQLARIRVTDSGGHSELRPVIETLLVLGPVTKRVRLTLADRSTMLFRMILGRKAIEGAFVVDVSRKYLQPRPPPEPAGPVPGDPA